MLGCKINIDINGTIESFNSQQELDDFIKLNYNKIQSAIANSTPNVRFSKNDLDKSSEQLQILIDLKNEAVATYEYEIDGTKYEVPKNEIRKKNKNSIGVTTFLNQLKVNDRFLFTPFDKNNYIQYATEQKTRDLVNSGLPEADARKKAIEEVNETVKSWPLMADLGTEVHSVAALFFDTPTPNFSTFNTLYTKQGGSNKVSNETLNQLYDGFNQLKAHMLSIDPNMKFLTEVPIYDEQSGIVGIIDFIGLDSNGVAHIVDFKTSFKYVSQQDKDKAERHGYQLSMYKRLLESKGITVKEATIMPIKLNTVNDKYDKVDSIEIEALQNMGTIITNPLSNENIVAKDAIVTNKTLSEFKFEGTSIINDEQKAFFNISSEDDLDNQYNAFLRQRLKKEGDKQYFYDEKNRARVYLKEINPNPTTQEQQDENTMNSLRNEGAIKEYILLMNNSRYEYITGIKASLQNDIKNNKGYTSPFKRVNSSGNWDTERENNARNTFSHYVNGQYEILDMPELEAQGIIVFRNKTSNYLDFVAVMSEDSNSVIKLTKDTNLLGEFRGKKEMEDKKYKLPSTAANHIGIKILSILNKNADKLNAQGITINRIQTFNYLNAQQVPVLKENLIENYKVLTHETGREYHLDKLKMTRSEDELLSAIDNALSKIDDYSITEARIINNLNTAIGATIHSNAARVAELRKVKEQFESMLNVNFNNFDMNTDLGLTYAYLNQLITDLSNETVVYEDVDMQKGLAASNSVLYTSYHEVRNRTARVALTPIRVALDNMRNEYIKHNQKFRKVFEKFYEAKGVSTFLGNHQSAFSNLYERNEKGEIDKQFRFKNPDAYLGNSDYLEESEREFLREILPELGVRMYGELGVANAKATGDYFNVPLKRATESSKIQENAMSVFTKPKAYLENFLNSAIEENFLFDEQRKQVLSMADNMAEMYNKYTASKNISKRQELLDAYDTVEFEKNLEHLFADVVFTDMKVEAYNSALPMVTAALVTSKLQQQKLGNFNLDNAYDYIQNYVKSVVYNEKLTTEGERKALQVGGGVKHAVSMLQLGMAPLNLVRETLQGQWASISKLAAKRYGEGTPSFKNYKDALGIIIGEGKDFVENVTMTEELNHLYSMANMDTNGLAEKMVVSKTGMTQLTNRWWLWFMGAPDYFNRMGFFLAKMLKDDSYKAHTFVDGVLTYDWTKDGRFEAYATGDKTNPDYAKQRGLYLAYLEQFNKEYRQAGRTSDLVEGDPLPLAYPTVERESIKMFVNYMHGPYDQEDKILFNNTLMGVLFMQFRTWMLAKKQQYYMRADTYSIGAFEHMMDSATGKPLYVTYADNGDGELNTEGIGTPVYEWRGRYMEGVLQSLKRIGQEVFSGDWDGVKDTLRKGSEARSNLTMLGIEMGTIAAIALAFGAIDLGELEDDQRALYSILEMVQQSSSDMKPWEVGRSVLDGSMWPSVTYLYRNFDNFSRVLTGSKDWYTALPGFAGGFRFIKQTSTILDPTTTND